MESSMTEQAEPKDIRWIRKCLINWPFSRGKGLLMRHIFRRRLENRDFLMEVEPGILVPAEMNDYMVYWTFVEGFAQASYVRFSRMLIRPGDTVLDVGANIGLWVMGAARLAGPEGRIHAFEPVVENFERLTSNLALNNINWVRCHPLALSDKNGSAVFYGASNNNSGMGSLAQHEGVDRPMDVELMRLDDFCEKQGIERVDFMKVDVEGAEILVFRGASRLLAAPEAPIIMFESADVTSVNFGASTKDIKTLLHEYGYNIFRFDGKRLEVISLDQKHDWDDLFALKPSHFKRHQQLKDLLP